jgi:alpha-N-arabinofuranosidase
MYVGNSEDDYYKFQASPVDLARRIEITDDVIKAALSNAPPNKQLYIAWDEWNVWYRARGDKERGRRILEEHYNLEDALFVSSFLNTFVNHAQIIKIANLAQLVNVIAPIFANENGIFLQTIYYPLQLFAHMAMARRSSCLLRARPIRRKSIARCLIWMHRAPTMTGQSF